MNITEKEARLIARMLDDYASRRFDQGCDDTPDEWIKEFTAKERVQMSADYHKQNGDPEDDIGQSWKQGGCLVRLMAHKMGGGR